MLENPNFVESTGNQAVSTPDDQSLFFSSVVGTLSVPKSRQDNSSDLRVVSILIANELGDLP